MLRPLSHFFAALLSLPDNLQPEAIASGDVLVLWDGAAALYTPRHTQINRQAARGGGGWG